MEFDFGNETIRITHPTREALMASVAARMAAQEGYAIATLNLDHIAKLHASPPFKAAYCAQDIVVADGHPIVWLSHLARRPVGLVPGSDLVVPLAALAARRGVPVALVGSTPAALDGAAAALAALAPGVSIVLRHAPPMGFDASGPAGDAVLDAIASSGAGLVLLALGAPRQELLAARGRAALPTVGFASLGAGLDFLAGRQRRAPLWMRRLALEWLWRALSNPVRLGPRYLASARVIPGQVRHALRLRHAR
ncbi:MAG: WecB/TagA/CpsF family glycosyltransferase [Gemmobacter sp.]